MPQGSAEQLPLQLETPESGAIPPVSMRISDRARHLQLKVSPWKGIEVIVPRRRSQREVNQFLAQHRDWIERTWEKLLAEFPDAGRLVLPQTVNLPAAGDAWEVRLAARKTAVLKDGVVCLPQAASLLDNALSLQKIVRQRAGEWLPGRMQPWIERTGLEPARISIRGQQGRWGSCSSHDTISLNFRLMFLNTSEVDCLLLHELCHLKHRNHGKRFWGLMEKYMPDVRSRDRALSEAWRDVPGWALVRA